MHPQLPKVGNAENKINWRRDANSDEWPGSKNRQVVFIPPTASCWAASAAAALHNRNLVRRVNEVKVFVWLSGSRRRRSLHAGHSERV